MNTFEELLLGLLILWTFFLAGVLIWNNPFTYQQVSEAEEDEDGPWPKT